MLSQEDREFEGAKSSYASPPMRSRTSPQPRQRQILAQSRIRGRPDGPSSRPGPAAGSRRTHRRTAAGSRGVGARSGRWFRRGNRIVLLGVWDGPCRDPFPPDATAYAGVTVAVDAARPSQVVRPAGIECRRLHYCPASQIVIEKFLSCAPQRAACLGARLHGVAQLSAVGRERCGKTRSAGSPYCAFVSTQC